MPPYKYIALCATPAGPWHGASSGAHDPPRYPCYQSTISVFVALIAIYLFAVVPVMVQDQQTEDDNSSAPISLVIASVVSLGVLVAVNHIGSVLLDLVAIVDA